MFILQQNDGCLIILQMSFASQLCGRCYLLPEQLSKDQSSTLANQNALYWITFLTQPLFLRDTGFPLLSGWEGENHKSE